MKEATDTESNQSHCSYLILVSIHLERLPSSSTRFHFVFPPASSDLVLREASGRSDTNSMEAATAASE